MKFSAKYDFLAEKPQRLQNHGAGSKFWNALYLKIELSLQFTINFNEATGFQNNGAEFLKSITSSFESTFENIIGIFFLRISFDELIPIQTLENANSNSTSNSNSRKRLVRQAAEEELFTLSATIELNVYDDLNLDQVLKKVRSGMDTISGQVDGMSNVTVNDPSVSTTDSVVITPQPVIQVRNDVLYAILFPIFGLILVGTVGYFWYSKRRRSGHDDI